MAIPMLRSSSSSSSIPSLPPPSPKSPPEYPDLYGKRREMAKVQMLEREISFLEFRRDHDSYAFLFQAETRRIAALVAFGNGSVTVNHAVVAVAATVFHPSVAPYLSGTAAVVSLVPNQIAVKIALFREIVVLFQVVAISGAYHALLYAVANAPALALAQHVQNVQNVQK
ncbi:hypothetical protein KIW84_040654 [Lathyrus oleraceus]|uniref:Uncharacterized protein n=1 Tax=Pisum sativum TaxID=3888 RepID=A0A9D4X9B2_PEA|nr:hypothetical protein KIW84_040654 [Pisum sativum]